MSIQLVKSFMPSKMSHQINKANLIMLFRMFQFHSNCKVPFASKQNPVAFGLLLHCLSMSLKMTLGLKTYIVMR